MIPQFDEFGLLPDGIHFSSWKEFNKRFGVNQHRTRLISGLVSAAKVLKGAGCLLIYVDGSFVTSKSYPSDYDACWDVVGVNPYLLDRLMIQFDELSRQLLRVKYFGDLFPAQISETRSGKSFVDFFQTDKETGRSKGIVALKPQKL
ncbi:MAG TPA: hypothetical protein VL728_06655 [Cyclobacteriaceae bacterium]|jgi:hypothetical protein|nr:hypothetical protein [Cyclobacteriaceae bacterium]